MALKFTSVAYVIPHETKKKTTQEKQHKRQQEKRTHKNERITSRLQRANNLTKQCPASAFTCNNW